MDCMNNQADLIEPDEEFVTIISSGTEVMRRMNSLLDKTAIVYAGYEVAFVGIYNVLQIELKTAMDLFQDYNEAATKMSKLTNISLEVVDIDKLMTAGNADPDAIPIARLIKPDLDMVLRNSKKSKTVLDSKIKPIPLADVERLGHLRAQLERISTNTKSDTCKLYTKNIELAIEEAENGHDLAPAMISSKVFAHILEQA